MPSKTNRSKRGSKPILQKGAEETHTSAADSSAVVGTESKSDEARQLLSGLSALSLKPSQVVPLKRSSNISTDNPEKAPSIACDFCAKIGRVLACCKDSPGTCELCTAHDALRAEEIKDPKDEHQITDDHIESLRVQWHELDEEDKRLAVVLKEKQEALKQRRAEIVRELGPLFKQKKQGKKGKKK